MNNLHANQTTQPDHRAAFLSDDDFELLYAQYSQFVLRVCYALSKDEIVAADMTQEIFCTIWDRRATLSVRSSWENYLYRCAKYQFYNHQRSLARFRTVRENVAARNPGWDDSTRQYIEFTDLSRNINELVQQLPDQCKKVYQMSRQQGLNSTEISKELLLSEKTVKNHLTRALGFLRRNIETLFALFLMIG